MYNLIYLILLTGTLIFIRNEKKRQSLELKIHFCFVCKKKSVIQNKSNCGNDYYNDNKIFRIIINLKLVRGLLLFISRICFLN